MIEPTDEMVQLALDVFLATPTDSIAQIDAGMVKALTAVLAIVERDLTVWVTFDRDEASILTATESAETGKRAAQEDSPDRTLRWEERRDGRFVDTGWVYEVRPFKLGGAP